METAVAPKAETAKSKQAKEAAPAPAKSTEKPVAKPGPVVSKLTIKTVQQASGNLAIQKSLEAGEAEPSEKIEKAPADPQEDPAYQAVVKQLRVKSKHEKTPPKDATEKKQEVKEASELPRAKREEKTGLDHHLEEMEAVPTPKIEDFTVAGFVELFRAKIDQIASKLPAAKEEKGAISKAAGFVKEKLEAVQHVKEQNQNLSAPLRKEVAKDPAELREKISTDTPELNVDPAGDTPNIANAKAAAVKPRTEEEVSMDKESRALDDALKNHDVAGQKINIEESSLAYPESGEKEFDEAGESKRKAQEAIAKVFPWYRAKEKPVIAKAEAEVPVIVQSGLGQQHKVRSEKFGDVLVTQKSHESTIETEKDRVFGEFQKTYGDAKKLVEDELKTIGDIETEFETVITDAENKFKSRVRQDLEYIYTPGFFDYSNWKDLNAKEIQDEVKNVRKEWGGDYPEPVYALEAMNIVRDRHAKALFIEVKDLFIWRVMQGVERIGQKVVQALNNANNHIRTAQDKTKKEYAKLGPKEQAEMEIAYTTILGQYENLASSVKDRQTEIVADMARNYTKSVGKLQATFDSIKKDVLTSWLEKAWNKIKAVVNAIIEFAKRVAELLVRMLHLVGDIVTSPRAFFRNLASGISQGFSTFVENIGEYLATAFFDWIRGTSGVRVQLPKEWNAAGIFSLFTQLLNLSTETIWQRMEVVYDKTVADAFRRGEAVVEKGLEIFEIIKKDGLGGLWDYIVESLGTLLSDTLDQMKETVLYAAIKKVLFEIGKMLVPGGGFIAIAEKVIRLLVFIVEARDKILDLIESFVSSMENAVRGDISGIVTKVTGALTKFITVALDFLVAFFGLSGLKEKVERLIERMRTPIIKGIDFVLLKFKPLVMKGKELVAKGVEAGKKVVAKVASWLGISKRFTTEGESHKLFFRGTEGSAELWVATDEMPFTTLLEKKKIEIDAITDATKAPKLAALINAARIYTKDILRLKNALVQATDDALKIQLQSDLNDKFDEIVPHLVVIGVGAGDALPDTEVRIGSPQGQASWVEADPVTKHKSKKNRRVTEEPLGWASHIKTIPGYEDIYINLHLLHFDLGGPGNDTGNLTPGRKSENTNMYNGAEENAINLVHSQQKVLWYRAEITGYRSEEGYTHFAEGIRIQYGLKEKNADGKWAKVGDVTYDNIFPVSKPGPKGTLDPTPNVNELTYDYWEDVLNDVPNRPTRAVYRELIDAKNMRGSYKKLDDFFDSPEFKNADARYGGNLRAWFESAIALGKIRTI